MRKLLLLLFGAGLGILSGQPLPSYLIDTFPAPDAFGVPVNVNIVLRSQVALSAPPPFAPAGYYMLKASTGATVSFTSNNNFTSFGTVLIPSAPLAPNTLYTFTVNPGSSVGSSYSFSFTTGGTADTSPPILVGVDPPSGSTGLGLNGPFKFQFSKRITGELTQGVTIAAVPSYLYAYFPQTTLGDDGTSLTITVSVQQGYPASYIVTVDPTQFVDAYGNAGSGAPVTAIYTTFVATDSSGPHLKASLPADGDTSVPTNVIPRLIFQKSIDGSTVSKGVVLQGSGEAQSVSFTVNGQTDFTNAGTAISIVPSKLLTPGQTYTLTINANLHDVTGFPVQAPQTIRFTTGPGPDTIAPIVLGQSPPVQSVPSNMSVLIRTNKPIASIVPDRMIAGSIRTSQLGNGYPPISATLSTDGTLLTLTPRSPLSGTYYTVNTTDIVDTTGAPFFSSNSGTAIQFNVTDGVDNTPLALLAVNPPPDSIAVPLSVPIRLLFNKTCATCLFPGTILVSAADGSKTTKVTAEDVGSNTSFTVNAGTLSASTTYTVLVTGIMDLAGSPMADYSYSFTTAGGPVSSPRLNLLNSSPSNGDTGVSPSASFVVHYDGILNPVVAARSASLVGPASFVYPYDGERLRFDADHYAGREFARQHHFPTHDLCLLHSRGH